MQSHAWGPSCPYHLLFRIPLQLAHLHLPAPGLAPQLKHAGRALPTREILQCSALLLQPPGLQGCTRSSLDDDTHSLEAGRPPSVTRRWLQLCPSLPCTACAPPLPLLQHDASGRQRAQKLEPGRARAPALVYTGAHLGPAAGAGHSMANLWAWPGSGFSGYWHSHALRVGLTYVWAHTSPSCAWRTHCSPTVRNVTIMRLAHPLQSHCAQQHDM